MNITRRFFGIACLLTLTALLLVACGSFAVEGEAQPDGEGGITITGEGQVFTEESEESSAPILGENATQILLILSGFAIFILILLVLVGRSSGHTHS
jgi:hypothetical protein